MGGFTTEIVLQALARSLALASAVALLSGALGIVMAWLVARAEFPGRRAAASLLSVPYALPCYLLAMAWVVLGNPTVGMLKDWLPAGGSYGFGGMALVLSSVAFAFPYFELRAGFDRLDPSLEEAARMSGAGPWRVFRDVSLRLLWPAWLNGMTLAFLFALAAFGSPAILGLPVRQYVLTTLIYSQFRLGGADGLARGFGLSLVLLAFAVAGLALSAWLTRRARRGGGAIGGGKVSRPSRVELGQWRYAAAALAWGMLAVGVALPWLALGLSALAPVAGKFSPALWTTRNLAYVLGLADFHEALLNTLLLSVASATLVVAAGFFLAYAATRLGRRWAKAAIEALALPFAAPGTVLAMALILVSARLAGYGVPADTPLLLLAVAYSLKYAAVGARSTAEAFRQVHPSLEEAARVSGATRAELLSTIWFPLLRRSLGAAWLLAALPMVTELTMSVLLTGPGAATLGTVLFQLQEYADQPSAAALAWMLLTLTLGVGWLTRAREEPRPRVRPQKPQESIA